MPNRGQKRARAETRASSLGVRKSTEQEKRTAEEKKSIGLDGEQRARSGWPVVWCDWEDSGTVEGNRDGSWGVGEGKSEVCFLTPGVIKVSGPSGSG